MKADLINSQVYCADLKVRNFPSMSADQIVDSSSTIAGPLYESATPRHLHVSSCCHNMGKYCSDCSHELDSRQYRWSLHAVCYAYIWKENMLLTISGNSTQPGNFTCPNGRAFFSSSIVWGQFSMSQVHPSILLRINYLCRCYWPTAHVWTRRHVRSNTMVLADRRSSSRGILCLNTSIPSI